MILKIFEDTVLAEVGYVSEDKKIMFISKENKIKVQEKSEVLLNSWRNTINW